jgi:hypothetical protein
LDIVADLTLKRSITVWNGNEKSELPDWAAALIWAGHWCRATQLPGHRLIAFVLLPTRGLAAAFVALGALSAGARFFSDELTWPRFRAMPAGTMVHWKERGGAKRFSGRILSIGEYRGTEFIRIEVTKPAASRKGGLLFGVSQSDFETLAFTEQPSPTHRKIETFQRAEKFFGDVLGDINPRWMQADGTEGLLVTAISEFQRTMLDLSLSTDASDRVFLEDLLCTARVGHRTAAKVRLSHPRGEIGVTRPLAILDGPDAFYVHEHLKTSNVLTILDYSEYSAGIRDQVIQLAPLSQDNTLDRTEMPSLFPKGFALAAFVVKRGD